MSNLYKVSDKHRGTGVTTRAMTHMLHHQISTGQCMVYVHADPTGCTLAMAEAHARKYARLLETLGIECRTGGNTVFYAGKHNGEFTGRTVSAQFLHGKSPELNQKQGLEVGYIYEADFL